MATPIKTWFIVNPISGVKNKEGIPELLTAHLKPELFDYDIRYTQRAGHGTELAKEATSQGIELVVAVGGDGTINEIARSLIGSNVSLGIIPMGSGNGFARHLKIPLKLEKAIQHLNRARNFKIDTATVNDLPFLCTAGIGFDAHISKVFSEQDSRGFKTYIKSTINEFNKYEPKTYQITVDNKESQVKAFALTMANACQYGNNTLISPNSNLEDGQLEFCILTPFPLAAFPIIGLRLFNGTILKSKYYSQIPFKTAIISSKEKQWIHVDGEPVQLEGDLTISVHPASLNVFA